MASAWVANFFISVHPLLEAREIGSLRRWVLHSRAYHWLLVCVVVQEDDDPPECKYALNQLKCDSFSLLRFVFLQFSLFRRYNARVLFVYFMWFSVARASLFVWLRY